MSLGDRSDGSSPSLPANHAVAQMVEHVFRDSCKSVSPTAIDFCPSKTGVVGSSPTCMASYGVSSSAGRALDCGSSGRRFDPCLTHKY